MTGCFKIDIEGFTEFAQVWFACFVFGVCVVAAVAVSVCSCDRPEAQDAVKGGGNVEAAGSPSGRKRNSMRRRGRLARSNGKNLTGNTAELAWGANSTPNIEAAK